MAGQEEEGEGAEGKWKEGAIRGKEESVRRGGCGDEEGKRFKGEERRGRCEGRDERGRRERRVKRRVKENNEKRRDSDVRSRVIIR